MKNTAKTQRADGLMIQHSNGIQTNAFTPKTFTVPDDCDQ